MTDNPNLMPQAEEAENREEAEAKLANMLTLEIVFLAVVGLVVIAAFFEALSYQLVSSRTPFVIMVPLFLLIVIHARRLFKVRQYADFGHRLRMALRGEVPGVNKVAAMSGWMAGLLVLIMALGHYAGLLIFSFFLMWRAGERFKLAATVAVVSTVMIFVVFEFGFDVELYRGLLFRYFAGYRDF
ncbi:MAG: hypothetical protein HUJ27_05930 [Rhodobacteraceae bacterium]|nr:hypothetical protein [Paracoccaceae bacterium]